MLVNNRWCDPGHVSVKKCVCSLDIELVPVGLSPFYLPWEFSSVIAITVYIPPSGKAEAVCDVIHAVTAGLQTKHPGAFIIITGDFKHVSLSSTLPTFYQFVTCTTGNNKILDLLYANVKDAYSSTALPPLGRSDHNLVCIDNTIPTKKVRCYPNNELWVTSDLQALLNEKKRAFRSGDRAELKRVQRELKRSISESKDNYRRKLEDKLEDSNSREVWSGMKEITGFQRGGGQLGGTNNEPTS
ncbi:uncharacterized protein LOC127353460 isoform X2 [Dicentrarchus labrax]|uniref:uncharacterized protein LOC127353460 isoform X2 n=1 Tax=Dicentrarchus labrax TaxID=13489 RepID=UPI0021F56479|nr:uncharacterized protein LOC127353460 isoform X2 [Dicentrarchus labrax]XP_051238683.1 uncharacterized protein LOC127353460 isoform X2 [Dicentrarchus labrax]XP_051238684.1 uncharacterized protein LOC127353460 isoform X2 [Dicentrarchus labrax]